MAPYFVSSSHGTWLGDLHSPTFPPGYISPSHRQGRNTRWTSSYEISLLSLLHYNRSDSSHWFHHSVPMCRLRLLLESSEPSSVKAITVFRYSAWTCRKRKAPQPGRSMTAVFLPDSNPVLASSSIWFTSS